jgi:SAM-dependent methyltransferase
MNRKQFYDEHVNFSCRTITEYLISPGIRAKFNRIKYFLGSKRFYHPIDLGCSGNSFIFFLQHVIHKSFFDISSLPLNQYSNGKNKISNNKKEFWHPLCGDMISLPYRENSFDFISALDVLEHLKDDIIAVSEMSRILKQGGIIVITVPHGMENYTLQDKLIGHYRRYEIKQILQIFAQFNLKLILIFGVYGKLMKFADIQSLNPNKLEKDLHKLRDWYSNNLLFRKFWDVIVYIGTKIMHIDSRFHPPDKNMNIGLIFRKR